MKVFKIHIIILVLIFITMGDLYASTRLLPPEKLKIEQLNKEQKDKLQNVQYSETLAIPDQYKGKLKFTEGKEEIHLKDVRLFFGAGGRYTLAKDAILIADSSPVGNLNTIYFSNKNQWSFDGNFNFFGSLGAYWRNGIRIEFEYSQMTLETNNYAKSFKKYTGTGPGNGAIFNQYLQTSSLTTYHINPLTGEVQYVSLNNNMIPVVEFSIKSYMVNFIFEKTNIKSKIRPYVGIGAGILKGDMISLESGSSSIVLGGQVMVGLSYPISNDSLAIYLGYRGVFSQDMEQTFTRIVNASLDGVPNNVATVPFNGTTYYNPVFFKTKETFGFQTHNLDLGVKFYF